MAGAGSSPAVLSRASVSRALSTTDLATTKSSNPWRVFLATPRCVLYVLSPPVSVVRHGLDAHVAVQKVEKGKAEVVKVGALERTG